MKNGVLNILRSFVIVAVFACISCSHQKQISDGGLSTNDMEGSERNIAAEPSNENSGDQAVLEKHDDLEAAVVANNSDTGTGTTSDALAIPEDGSKAEDVLVAKTDTPVELLPATENAESHNEELADSTPSAAEIAAAVNEQTGTTNDTITPATADTKSVATPVKKTWKRKHTAPKVESRHETTSSPIQAVQAVPAQPTTVTPPTHPVIDPFKGGEDEEKAEPQTAQAGISSFVEAHAFGVASLTVGFVLCLFFFAKRKKASDDGFNL